MRRPWLRLPVSFVHLDSSLVVQIISTTTITTSLYYFELILKMDAAVKEATLHKIKDFCV